MAPTDKPTLARAQGSRWTSALHPALLSPRQSTGPVMPVGPKSGGPILFRRCPHAPIEPMFSEGRHVPLGLQRREWWLSGWVDLVLVPTSDKVWWAGPHSCFGRLRPWEWEGHGEIGESEGAVHAGVSRGEESSLPLMFPISWLSALQSFHGSTTPPLEGLWKASQYSRFPVTCTNSGFGGKILQSQILNT